MRAFPIAAALVAASPAFAAGPDASTVAVQAVTPTGDGRAAVATCAGVLIAPDIVLTAGHCLDRVARPAQTAVFAYRAGKAVPPPIAVLRIARHPDHAPFWRETAGDPATRQREVASDMALVKLATPITAQPPARVGAAPGDGTGAGVGREGPGAAARSGGLKRFRVSGARLSTGGGARVGFATLDRPACTGDSGGPLADASGAVWGLIAAVLKPAGGCGTRVTATPVDPPSEGFRRMRAALD